MTKREREKMGNARNDIYARDLRAEAQARTGTAGAPAVVTPGSITAVAQANTATVAALDHLAKWAHTQFADEYVAGRIDSDELVARARARYGLA